MNRSQLILTVSSIGLATLLFQLPRSVVENEQLQEVESAQNHSMEMPQRVLDEIEHLRFSITSEQNVDKKVTFAYALANRFLDYGILDSAVVYANTIQDWREEASVEVADIYFTAYERTPTPEKGVGLARKAEKSIRQLLKKDSANLFWKNRLAMTLVASDSPMSGINMLREIVAENPKNRQAILNLGLLAIQSGQFERAKKRFETLLSLDSADNESKLYLAVAMMKTNKPMQARLLLEEILMVQDSIPAIKMMANDYLKTFENL